MKWDFNINNMMSAKNKNHYTVYDMYTAFINDCADKY